MKSFSEIVEKIKEIQKLKTDQEVADLFEWPRQTLNNYKRENRIPFKHLVDFCERKNISLDFLLLGRGEPALGKPGDDLAVRVKKIEELLKNKLE